MAKKLVLGALFAGLIGILVAGGVIRTLDKTSSVAEARGFGSGDHGAYAEDAGRQGQGRGRGQGGQDGGTAERLYSNRESVTAEQVSYDGTVVQTPESGGDLFVRTEDGQEIKVGTGPGYMEAQSFTLQNGEQVTVQGYWEGEELKATRVTRLQDGQSIALRDESGRPAWAGSGRQASEVEAADAQAGEAAPGQGRGQGRGQGQGQGGSRLDSQSAAAPGVGQAQVSEWLTLQGTVVEVDADALIVDTDSDGLLTIENRPWWFAQELGFTAKALDSVTLTGFYDNDDFEVGRLENVTSGLVAEIREESGRPGWAGRGRWGE